MSQVPIGAAIMDGAKAGHGTPFPKSIIGEYGKYGMTGGALKSFSQFGGADMMVDKYGLTRQDLDAVAASSHARAVAAKGKFAAEILPMPVLNEQGEKTG